MTNDALKLNDLLKPGQPLPSDEAMISTALDILNHSAHGQQLVDFVRINAISLRIMSTPQPTTYLPESTLAYIGFNRNNPVSPSRFVLMLAGILREAQQEGAGIKNPQLHAPLEEHMKVSMAKHEDKLWYMCTVACELNDIPTFMEYKFLDELRKMGHHESLDLYLKQEKRK
ncbi:MAG: hypothetical protein RBS08_06155 [Bdellovibrionales bacterium]|jgi:hypothetical protein|nr:hypothetical protein [Bdellovibrionales bacterium]